MTFGLLLTVFGCVARQPQSIAYAVGLYITAAYWFTASTSFANPAVTVARALSNTFAGIRPNDVMLFIGAQLLGAVCALAVAKFIVGSPERIEAMADLAKEAPTDSRRA